MSTPVSTLIEDLARVTREASRLAVMLNEARFDGMTQQQHVLLRCVAGHGVPAESASLDIPLDGARLMVARAVGQLGPPSAADVRRPMFVSAPINEGTQVVLVRGVPRSADHERGRSNSMAVECGLRSRNLTVRVGASSPLSAASGIPEAYREAVDAAEIAVREDERLVFADEHWADLALLRVRRGFSSTLPMANPITRLHAHDLAKGSDLEGTLVSWLANNCEVSATAASLRLHPNTLRYRLRRAADIAGFDLSSPDHRVLLHLGLGRA